ncbi:unnamed protein product [Adineta steineri]|uniref:Nephrocystin-3 n=1 Tax=Adineta steineri TaxID=433720 RepID=A0A815MVS3_9BILA|nr:unnamed protein product [Adineta steineri]CAF1623968.1 unnamed protein product [Adineta steineri]
MGAASIKQSSKVHPTNTQDPVTEQHVQDVNLIWVGALLNNSNEVIMRENLQTVNHYVQLIPDIDAFRAHLPEEKAEKIFVVINGTLAKDFIDKFHDNSLIDSIFIFDNHPTSESQEVYEGLQLSFVKVASFTEFNAMKLHIATSIKELLQQTVAFGMFDDKQKLARDLNRDAASFLWFQMLLDVLKGIPQENKEKRIMLDMCRRIYHDNSKEMKLIREFDKDYKSTTAVWWYTRECFLYRLVNKALRQEDIRFLQVYRFFIVDLCNQLEQEHRKRVENDSDDKDKIIDLYRGQQMTKAEKDKLKSNLNSLISTNGFFSTSQNIETAITFAKRRGTGRSDIVPVVFHIKAKSNLESVIFADIANLGAMPGEAEYLFSIGAVFHIDEIKHDSEERIWRVTMTATDKGAKSRKEYIEKTKLDMEETSEDVLFGRLLIDMSQYEDAESYYQSMLSTISSNHVDHAAIYHNLGRAKGYKGDLNGAQESFLLALRDRQHIDEKHPNVARTLNSIGIIYGEQGKYTKAMNTFKDALEIQELYSSSLNGSNKPQKRSISLNMAITYSNMGWVYYLCGEFEKAKKAHCKALDIRKQYLTDEHPLIADYYSSIGSIEHAQGLYKEALANYTTSLNMRRKTLPQNHPSIANSYQLLGELGHDNGKYDKALAQYKIVEEMRIASFGVDHSSLASIYKSIGSVHLDCGQYQTALDNYNHALSICKKTLSEMHPAFGDCYHMLGMVFERQEKYDMALQSYSKSRDNFSKVLPKNHPMIAKVVSSIGNVQMRQMKYAQAIRMYEDVLKMQEECLSNTQHHPDIVLTLNNFGVVYSMMRDFQQSETYFTKALDICNRCFASDHPTKARIFHNMGDMYKAMSHLEKAHANFIQAFNIRENTLSDDHLSTADTCYKLGWVCSELRDFNDALFYFNKCLGIYQSVGAQRMSVIDDRDVKRVTTSIRLVKRELEIE